MAVVTQIQFRRGTAAQWTTTNPTLAAGELGFETDTGKFKIGNGSSTWTALSYASGGQNTLTTYQYTATAGQTTFSGADSNSNTLSYTAGAVQVYLNGALLANTTDYAASTGTSVLLTAGAGLGDSLTVLSIGSFTVSTDIPKSVLTAKGSLIGASGAATPANLAVGANNTVLTADSATATGLKWAAAAGGKVSNNKILNGDFFINQRAFTSNTATGAYNFDRFQQTNVGGTTTVTPQTFTPGTAPVAGYEGATYLRSITASQSDAGDYAFHSQRIESVRTMANQSVVISFWAMANTGTPKVGIQLVQNFGTGGSPSAEVSTPISAITLTTSWAMYEVTITCPSISGKTIGTNPNTSYLALNLWQSAGATFATQSSTTGIQNFTLSLWGIQLEAGTSATGFLTATGTFGSELSACQRYFYNPGNSTRLSGGFAISTTVAHVGLHFVTTMRVVPTVVLAATGPQVLIPGNTIAATSVAAPEYISANSMQLVITVASGLNSGGAVAGYINANNALISAEL